MRNGVKVAVGIAVAFVLLVGLTFGGSALFADPGDGVINPRGTVQLVDPGDGVINPE
jgi:hypothetical protein